MVLRMRVREGEPIGLALRRFKKMLDRSGITREMRKRAYYVSNTQRRRQQEFRKWLAMVRRSWQGRQRP
jgi:small subunit ribosomal protein S21